MTTASAAVPATPPGLRVRAVVGGLLVTFVGAGPWIVLASLNARVRPDIPWAAGFTLLHLGLLLAWLRGYGPPRATSRIRRERLRLEVPRPSTWSGEARAEVAMIVVAMAGLTVMWILVSGGQRLTDLSPYPTPAYRISVLVMGALVSGVVEEAAFRGYLQTRLEPYGVEKAIALTSVTFVLVHVTHGVAALLLMAPGYFVASYLYGMLAWRTGSIVPGMIIHVLGDLSHTIFAVLGGDLGQLMR